MVCASAASISPESQRAKNMNLESITTTRNEMATKEIEKVLKAFGRISDAPCTIRAVHGRAFCAAEGEKRRTQSFWQVALSIYRLVPLHAWYVSSHSVPADAFGRWRWRRALRSAHKEFKSSTYLCLHVFRLTLQRRA